MARARGRALRWFGWSVLVLFLAGVLFLVLFDWNVLRGPIERAVAGATGRELRIEGDLKPVWSWLHPRVRAERLSFANPQWAAEKHLVQAAAIEASVSVLPLLRGRVVIPDLHLAQPVVSLEISQDGDKSWVLGRKEEKKQDESKVDIRRLTVDEGRIRFVDATHKTDLAARVSTRGDAASVVFEVSGQYKGLPASGKGSGGSIISVQDDAMPYPLNVEASVGKTAASAEGTITGLASLSAVDLKVGLRGDTLEDLFPIIGIPFPDTSRYSTSGRLIRNGTAWRYEGFTGKMGGSDIAGTVHVETSGKRPAVQAEIESKLLNFADLGPVIGTKKPAKGGVLPDAPYDPERWNAVDADVKVRAAKIQRPEQLPIDNLAAHLRMQDALLTIDPLEFGIAGGRISGNVRMDGRQSPIKAATSLRVNKLKLDRLVPTDKMKNTSIGDVSGAIELAGTGNSVARMLGSANGKIGVFVDGGEISHFLMELVAIDLWGLAKVALKGDEPINIRCMIADFGVKNGVMEANALVFDTAVVNINGGGTVNLKTEKMGLKLVPQPKDRSLASLNTPLYIQGTFSDPNVGPDVGKMAAKGLGAVLLGIVNPLLSVIPLFKEGEGKDSNCEALIADAAKLSGKKPKPRPR